METKEQKQETWELKGLNQSYGNKVEGSMAGIHTSPVVRHDDEYN